VQELEQVKRAEDFHRKSDEIKRRAFEQEVLRLEKETELRGGALAKMLQVKDNHLFEELNKEAELTRRREEELLIKRETDIRSRLREEHLKKKMRRTEEARLRSEEEQERIAREQQLRNDAIRKADEERRLHEEQLRRQKEVQLRIDTERKQREVQEQRRVQEEQPRRQEEEQLREVESRRHQEVETQKKAEDERLRQEEFMRQQREEFRRKEEERLQRETEQQRLDAELRLKEEEEQKQRLEVDRMRREAEEKLRLEEELRRQIEEKHHKEEEQKRKQAEQRLRFEHDKKAREAEERQQRIKELLSNAEAFYVNGNYEHALVEVAKALVNEPSNQFAIQLESKIKEAQGNKEEDEKQNVKSPHRNRKQKNLKPKFEKREKARGFLSKPVYTIAAILATIIVVFIVIQLKNKIFPSTPSLAILPWKSTSNTPEEIIDGSSLAEEVAQHFQQFKQATVMGYTSSYGLTRYSDDPAKAVFHLGYSYALQGTVTKSALGFSVSLKLVDSVGSVHWSNQYDRSVSTLSTLPSEIASNVATSLGLTLQRTGTPLTSSSNPDAYLFYLRGLELMHRHTRLSTHNAYEVFQQAIELDQTFVQALAAASSCLTTMVEENWITPDSAIELAREYADKAIRANSSYGDGHVALGKALLLQRDYSGALEELNTALKYSSNSSSSYLNKGKIYLRTGKYKDAIEVLTKAYDLNPRDADILKSLGFAYQMNGKMEQSIWYHQTAVYFIHDSTEYLIGPLADAVLLSRDLSSTLGERIISACEHKIVRNPEDYATIYRLSRMLQVTGKRIEGTTFLEKSEKMLREKLKSEPTNGYAMAYMALTLTRLGKFTEAVTWGSRAAQLSHNNAEVKYRVAQMYSLQMYSSQKKKIDEKKKEEAIKALKEALRIQYRLDELTNADFYNMYEHGDFYNVLKTIQ